MRILPEAIKASIKYIHTRVYVWIFYGLILVPILGAGNEGNFFNDRFGERVRRALAFLDSIHLILNNERNSDAMGEEYRIKSSQRHRSFPHVNNILAPRNCDTLIYQHSAPGNNVNYYTIDYFILIREWMRIANWVITAMCWTRCIIGQFHLWFVLICFDVIMIMIIISVNYY